MSRLNFLMLTAAIIMASGCATLPEGPSVMALPGTGRTFEQFQYDDANCRSFALGQVGGDTSNQAAVNNAVTSAAIGTAIGAATGAAIGGGGGAAIGAAGGLATGSIVGANTGYASGSAVQQQYDAAYIQCMYAKGHQVPVSGNFPTKDTSSPSVVIPPPPPGLPPPPPPS